MNGKLTSMFGCAAMVVAALSCAGLARGDEVPPTAADCDTADAHPTTNNCKKCYLYEISVCATLSTEQLRESCLRASETGHEICRNRIPPAGGGGGNPDPIRYNPAGDKPTPRLLGEFLLGRPVAVQMESNRNLDHMVVQLMWREGEKVNLRTVGVAPFDATKREGTVEIDTAIEPLIGHDFVFVVVSFESATGELIDINTSSVPVRMAVEGDYNLDGNVSADDLGAVLDRLDTGAGSIDEVVGVLDVLTGK